MLWGVYGFILALAALFLYMGWPWISVIVLVFGLFVALVREV